MARWLKNRSVPALRVGVWLIAIGLFIVPLALVVSLALGGNHIPTLLEQGLGIATRNSLFTTALSALAAVIIGTVIAIALDRTDIYGSSVLRLFLLSPLMVPPFIGAIAWIQLFGPNQGLNKLFGFDMWNIYGADGVIALMTIHSFPVAYVIISSSLRSFSPDFELAARASGASVITVLRTITLPLLRPALLSAFTLTAIANLADFGIPALIGSPARFETLATMMYRFIDSGTVSNPLQVVSTIGVVLLCLGIGTVILDYFTSLKTSSSTHDSGSPARFALHSARWPVTIIMWVGGLSISIGPILGLAYRAVLPAPGVPLTIETVSLANFSSALSNPRVIEGLTNSAFLSITAAIICGILGWVIGILVTRTQARGNTLLTLSALLPSALPGLIIGVAWLIAGRYTGLYNTMWIILIAYICAFTALVVQSVRAPLISSPVTVEEAARVSGAGPLKALFSTTGAMAIPAAMSGAVIVAVTAIRELTISVLLVAPGTTTLGVQVFNLQQAGNYNQASALALLFSLLGIIALALTIRAPQVRT